MSLSLLAKAIGAIQRGQDSVSIRRSLSSMSRKALTSVEAESSLTEASLPETSGSVVAASSVKAAHDAWHPTEHSRVVDGPPGATGVLSGRGGRKRGSLVRSGNEVMHLMQGCHCALLQKLYKLTKSQTLNPQRS